MRLKYCFYSQTSPRLSKEARVTIKDLYTQKRIKILRQKKKKKKNKKKKQTNSAKSYFQLKKLIYVQQREETTKYIQSDLILGRYCIISLPGKRNTWADPRDSFHMSAKYNFARQWLAEHPCHNKYFDAKTIIQKTHRM